jgi:hypothetical protein
LPACLAVRPAPLAAGTQTRPPQAALGAALVSFSSNTVDTCLSHAGITFGASEALHKVSTMFWKFLSLQKILDALFDDSWCSLGLPEAFEGMEAAVAELS